MVLDRKILQQWENSLEAEQDRILRLLAHIRGLLADISGDDEAQKPSSSPTVRRRTRTAGKGADATYQVLVGLGHPEHRDDIYAAVTQQGITFGGKEPIRTFASILTRDSRFAKMGDRGFWGLSEWTKRNPAIEQQQENAAISNLQESLLSRNGAGEETHVAGK